MTKEAKAKPQAWTGQATILDRWAVQRLIQGHGQTCPGCGFGPLTFGNAPKKMGDHNRIFDAFKLEAVVEPDAATDKAIMAMLAPVVGADVFSEDDKPIDVNKTPIPSPIDVRLENDLVRFFLCDLAGPRARYGGFPVANVGALLNLPIIHQLLTYAEEARIKLDRESDDQLSEVDDLRVLNLSDADRLLLREVLRNPAACENPFPSRLGGVVACARPSDGPRDVHGLQVLCRLVEQLGFDGLFHHRSLALAESDEKAEYTVDMGTSKLLLGLISSRAHNLKNGAWKLRHVVTELEAHPNGGGKPKAVEAPAMPADVGD